MKRRKRKKRSHQGLDLPFLKLDMKQFQKCVCATHVFRNGNLGSFSMAAIIFTENPFVMVHPEMRQSGRERNELHAANDGRPIGNLFY